jgi:hypothetical protein
MSSLTLRNLFAVFFPLFATLPAFAANTISATGGNNLSQVVTTSMTLQATVMDDAGPPNPVSGASVTWSIGSGSGTLSATTSTTNGSGVASITLTLGTTPGIVTVKATLTGTTTLATFTEKALPGIAMVNGGNLQSVVSNTASSPITVIVKDSLGTPVSGVKVAWAVTAGGGVPAAATSISDGSGIASNTVTVGKLVGVNTVKAWVFGPTTAPATAAIFALNTIAAAPATLTVLSGSTQTGVAGNSLALPLKVTAKDANGNLVPNTTIDWAPVIGTGCVSSGFTGAASSKTGTSGTDLGVAVMTYRLGTLSGANCVTATSQVTPAATVQFKATGNPDAPKVIVQIAGSTQGTVGTVLPIPLKVKVLDQYSNPVAGKTIAWTGVCTDTTTTPSTACGSYTPASSVTGTDGTTTTALKLGNLVQNIIVTGTIPTTSVTFSTVIAARPAAAGKITISSGNNQSQTVNNSLAAPFVVTVTDSLLNPVPNVVVEWSVIKGNGKLANAFSNTNGSGVAQMTFIAGTAAGTNGNQVKANIRGMATAMVTFNVTGTPDLPALLVKPALNSGDLQTATVGTKVPLPLKGTVVDQFLNPISGATVNWTTNSADGAFFLAGTSTPATSSTSDALGGISISYQTGTFAAANGITATVGATAVTASYLETGKAGLPDMISIVSGNNQTADAGTVLGSVNRVMVYDVYNNPVPAAKVNWTGTGASASAAQTLTDTVTGQTSVNVLAGLVPGAVTIAATVDGQPAKTVSFAHSVRPVIDTLTPSSGPVNSVVNLVGQGFVSGTTVTFDTVGTPTPATCVIITPQQVSCLAPAHATGAISVAAQANSVSSLTKPFTFTSPGPAFTVSVSSGNNQTGIVGASPASPLVAVVRDVGNNAVPSLSLNWATVQGGALLAGDTSGTQATTSTTNGSGSAQVTVTFGPQTGVNQVNAFIAGLTITPATFTVTALPNTANGIAVLDGNNQTAAVHSYVALPVRVQVVDANSNPVAAGVTINWAIASGAGLLDNGAGGTSGVGLPSNTDANGVAQMLWRLGDVVGANSVTATINATATSVTFNATSFAGLPASITITGGNKQTGTAGATLPAPLTVLVKDTYANVIPNAMVAWDVGMVPSTSALSTVTNYFTWTDGTGTATNTLKLGATPGANTQVQVTALGGTSPTVTMEANASGWMLMSSTGAPSARTGYVGAWTGSKLVIWGGCGGLFSQNVSGVTMDANCTGNMYNDGAVYDPADDTWTSMSGAGGSGAPSARLGALSVWIGNKVFIWSGYDGTNVLTGGKTFDPAGSFTWTALTTSGEPSARMYAGGAWDPDDNLLFGWGGRNNSGLLSSGKGFRYSPSTGWTTTAWGTGSGTTAAELSARQNAGVFYWKKDASNKYIIVFGGDSGTGTTYLDGMVYEIATDTITTMKAITADLPTFVNRKFPEVVWTGANLIVRGGRKADGTILQDGAIYNPVTDTWTALAAATGYTARLFAFSSWLADTGKMSMFGGSKLADGLGIDINDYGLYTPNGGAGTWSVKTGAWAGKPAALLDQFAADGHGLFITPVNTGGRMIIWGGMSGSTGNAFGGGGIFTP